jgi:hypothetical protein
MVFFHFPFAVNFYAGVGIPTFVWFAEGTAGPAPPVTGDDWVFRIKRRRR